jgi:hypothetical protein
MNSLNTTIALVLTGVFIVWLISSGFKALSNDVEIQRDKVKKHTDQFPIGRSITYMGIVCTIVDNVQVVPYVGMVRCLKLSYVDNHGVIQTIDVNVDVITKATNDRHTIPNQSI